MADNTLDPAPSFGIIDTITSSSQELIDSFLDGDATVTSSPDDIKDIKSVEPPKEEPKKQEAKTGSDADLDKPTGPVDLDFDDIKDDEEEEEEKPAKKSPGKKVMEAPPKGEETSEETQEKTEESGEFNPFQAFSKELYNLGAFMKTTDDEEPPIPTTPEEFLETFNQQIGMRAEMAVDNFISRYGEDYQDAFEAIFVNGVDPREYFQTYNNIQNFAEADISSEMAQVAVVRQALADLDYDEEDINTEIDRLKSYGDLEEVAKKHHKVLVKKEAQKLEELAARQQQIRAQQMAVKRQFAASVAQTLEEKVKAKDFDGIPINPRLAEEVEEMLLAEKWKNSAGEPLTDFDVEILNLKRPENHAMKVKVALLLKILKQDPSLTTIKKSAITKQTNQLFSEVVRNQPKSSTATKGSGGHWSNL